MNRLMQTISFAAVTLLVSTVALAQPEMDRPADRERGERATERRGPGMEDRPQRGEPGARGERGGPQSRDMDIEIERRIERRGEEMKGGPRDRQAKGERAEGRSQQRDGKGKANGKGMNKGDRRGDRKGGRDGARGQRGGHGEMAQGRNGGPEGGRRGFEGQGSAMLRGGERGGPQGDRGQGMRDRGPQRDGMQRGEMNRGQSFGPGPMMRERGGMMQRPDFGRGGAGPMDQRSRGFDQGSRGFERGRGSAERGPMGRALQDFDQRGPQGMPGRGFDQRGPMNGPMGGGMNDSRGERGRDDAQRNGRGPVGPRGNDRPMEGRQRMTF